MAQNTLPSGIDELMQLADCMAHGLEIHGPWLKMMQTKPAEFRAALDNVRQSEAAFAIMRSEKAAAGKWMNTADASLTQWLAKARLALMLARGLQWSEAWLDTGFTHRATNVPKAIGPRIALARRVVDFFADNPQFTVAHANVTACHGRKLYDDIVIAQQVGRQLVAECSKAKQIRDAAERKLRGKMRGVVLILGATIKATDARWLEFGLNRPRATRAERRRTATPQATASITHLSTSPRPSAAEAA